ncbi:MAG: GAF domain-containing protein [Gammaproteobacteria bacterium]|nr:GAF domain-containing protein [Gammaproteobacteria bacterium]
MTDTDYRLLRSQLIALIDDETDALANASNFVGFLYHAIDDVNWLGIYVLRGNELVLGPFQGKPACVRIAVGVGVCGAAAATLETQRVADVDAFPGHIVCDANSRSELVVPLLFHDRLVGVLDIDSPTQDRFTAYDQEGIESLCNAYCEMHVQHDGFI